MSHDHYEKCRPWVIVDIFVTCDREAKKSEKCMKAKPNLQIMRSKWMNNYFMMQDSCYFWAAGAVWNELCDKYEYDGSCQLSKI